MNKYSKAVLILSAAIFLLIGTGIFYFRSDKMRILDRLCDHPQSAISLYVDGKPIAERNSDQLMPLASTVKIILAIEFAQQCSAGTLDPSETVPMEELAGFYVPNTDGGAHQGWLDSYGENAEPESATLLDVAKGMIKFSSNANTEYLCQKLGLAQINQRIDSLEIESHTAIYPIVSALFIGRELYPEQEEDELVESLRTLSYAEYVETANRIHDSLRISPDYKNELGSMGLEVQAVWSDRLPASTTSDYCKLMAKLNSRAYFDSSSQAILNECMEWIMENPSNGEWLQHGGMKGGSTASVLTKALYATDKEGVKIEMAYFMNGLGLIENLRLQASMNEFELAVLKEPEFRKTVADRIALAKSERP